MVLLGDGAVGKTFLLKTYLQGEFPQQKVLPTVVDSYTAKVTVKKVEQTVELTDTSGLEDMRDIIKLGTRETEVYILCYSCANQISLHNVKTFWLPEHVESPSIRVPFVLVGTKRDLCNGCQDYESVKKQAKALALEKNAFAELTCSARTGWNVEEVFHAAIYCAMRNRREKKGCCSIL